MLVHSPKSALTFSRRSSLRVNICWKISWKWWQCKNLQQCRHNRLHTVYKVSILLQCFKASTAWQAALCCSVQRRNTSLITFTHLEAINQSVMFSALQDKVLWFSFLVYLPSLNLPFLLLLQLVISTTTKGGYLCCSCVGRESCNAVNKSFFAKGERSGKKMVPQCLQICKL